MDVEIGLERIRGCKAGRSWNSWHSGLSGRFVTVIVVVVVAVETGSSDQGSREDDTSLSHSELYSPSSSSSVLPCK